MVAVSGLKANRRRAQSSFSRLERTVTVEIDRERLILLVEDNEDDEEMAVRALRKGGVRSRVIVVRDGEEALHFLFGEGAHAGRDISALPDLVLLDLKLPKLNGHDVLRILRS